MCSHEARSSVELSFVIKVYISVEVLSLWPCNQNVCSNKILFFFGLSLFSCLLLRSNFCFLPRRNSLVFSLFSLCTSVTLFLRLVILQDWEKKKKKKELYSRTRNSSTVHNTRGLQTRVLLSFSFLFFSILQKQQTQKQSNTSAK